VTKMKSSLFIFWWSKSSLF